jgi:hypothetical protein
MDIRELMCELQKNWIHLARERIYWGAVVNTAMNLQVP